MPGCFVLDGERAFAVDSDRSKTVSYLKKVILEKKKNDLASIDADNPILWKVGIPESNKREIHM